VCMVQSGAAAVPVAHFVMGMPACAILLLFSRELGSIVACDRGKIQDGSHRIEYFLACD
jgi:hypothetical protein